MYDLDAIKRALADPVRAISEINRLINRRVTLHRYNKSGIDVFDKDWDYLVLLDACRYDAFVEHSDLPGELSQQTSRGSSSVEFIRGNFAERELHDTIVVSGNGWYTRMLDDIDAEVHKHVWVDHEPDFVTAAALDQAEEHPNKRLIIHYMQPHFPYRAPGWEDVFYRGEGDLQETYRMSNVDQNTFWEAYCDNLEYVLPHVETLFEELDGRFVVSSDHGELLGEREKPIPNRRYGHPRGIYVDELVMVPWLEYESGPRRCIISEPPEESSTYDKEKVDQQLRDLGYFV
jgi:hypothetical protein